MSISNERKFAIKGRNTYRTEMSNVAVDYDRRSENEISEDESFDVRQRKQNYNEEKAIYLNKSFEKAARNTPQKVQTSEVVEERFVIKWLIIIVIAMFAGLFAMRDTTKGKSNIDGLKQIFPNQPNETFDNFETLLDEIVFKKAVHPAVFLFLYDKNEQKVNKLIHHLANYASQRLESNGKYIDIGEKEFHSKEAIDDYGYLIEKYRSNLIQKKVMVVKNLHNIPAQTAQVFHTFCDEFSPLIERVVYIFTLKVDSLNGKEEKIAERNLNKYWNELDSDILMPLITRVTSTVLKITN